MNIMLQMRSAYSWSSPLPSSSLWLQVSRMVLKALILTRVLLTVLMAYTEAIAVSWWMTVLCYKHLIVAPYTSIMGNKNYWIQITL